MKSQRICAAGLTLVLLFSMFLSMPVWAEDLESDDSISIIWLDDGLELTVSTGVEEGDLMPVVNQDGLYGFVDTTGKVVIEPQYDSAGSFSEGLAKVVKDDVISYIDLDGQVVFTLDGAENSGTFSCGRTWYTMDGLAGVVDSEGNYVTEPIYENIGGYSEDITWVMYEDLYGYIDLEGNPITDMIYGEAGSFNEGRAYVWTEDDGYGFIDTTGELVIPLQYTTVTPFNNGIASVCLDGSYGFIDPDGNTVVDFTLGYSDTLYEGLAYSRSDDGLYGFVDSLGQMVISPEYNYAAAFSCGLASVQKDGVYGYINMKGKTVVPLEYVAAFRFSVGLGRVYDGTYYGFYNADGDLILPVEYDDAAAWNYVAVVEKDGQSGFFINPYYNAPEVESYVAKKRLNVNWSVVIRYGIFAVVALALIAACVIPTVRSNRAKKAQKAEQKKLNKKK